MFNKKKRMNDEASLWGTHSSASNLKKPGARGEAGKVTIKITAIDENDILQ